MTRPVWSGITDKDLRKLIRAVARTDGWTVHITGSNHIRITAPCGDAVSCPLTPRSPRATMNTRAKLRRIGWRT